jgi:hypothetical protein
VRAKYNPAVSTENRDFVMLGTGRRVEILKIRQSEVLLDTDLLTKSCPVLRKDLTKIWQ